MVASAKDCYTLFNKLQWFGRMPFIRALFGPMAFVRAPLFTYMYIHDLAMPDLSVLVQALLLCLLVLCDLGLLSFVCV